MKIQLDMYQTIAVAVVVLMLGKFLKERVELLERFCIPAPVIGGVIFAIFTCLYISRIPGKFKGIKEWRKGIDRIPWTRNHTYFMPEFPCNRTCKAFTYQSACRTLYRLYPNDRGTWNSRCLWSGS